MGLNMLARFLSIFRKAPGSRKRAGRGEADKSPYLFKIKIDSKTLYMVRNRKS